MPRSSKPTSRRCGCQDPVTKKKLGLACPKLSNPRHGSWSFVADLPPGPNGKRRQTRRGGFPTERKALDALAAFQKEVRDGTYRESPTITVGEYLDRWLAGRVRIRESTAKGYSDHINVHLKPHIGHVVLVDLRAHHIAAMYKRIVDVNPSRKAARRREVGPATIASIHRTLRAALNAAVKQQPQLIAVNPCTFVELPDVDKPLIGVWAAGQVAVFLAYVDRVRDPLAAAFHLIVTLGLRRGELVGLRWECVNLDDGTIVFPYRPGTTIITVRGKARPSKPKTKRSARLTVLDSHTVAVLREWRQRQDEARTEWGDSWVETGLVFTRENGAGWHPDTVSWRFTYLSRKVGLPRIPLKNLRHTSATVGLGSGETLKEVSERLGHSTITITADTYMAVPTDVARASAERRRAAFVQDSDHRSDHSRSSEG